MNIRLEYLVFGELLILHVHGGVDTPTATPTLMPMHAYALLLKSTTLSGGRVGVSILNTLLSQLVVKQSINQSSNN